MTHAATNLAAKLRHSWRSRKGIILVLTALLLVFMVALIAFAVDLGYIAITKTELQSAIDAATLAGAGDLVNGTTAARATALNFLAQNKVGGRTLDASNVNIEFGIWDANSRTFTVNNTVFNGVRITGTNNNQPLFFGSALGRSTFNLETKSTAVYKPRDVAFVLDYSGSMGYDSQFRSISKLGQPAIEANLLQIYQQLGSPTYGTLTYTPVKYGSSSTSNSDVLKNFKLDKVAWPNPSGSWDNYVDYVQTDSYVKAAGYQNCYGYMTWVNYLQAKQSGNSRTPALKNVSEQPLTCLKDAVDAFLAYLTAHATDDQVSLSIYSYSDNTAVLEQGLTKNYSLVSNITRARQAGHYVGGTNISAGMTKGRQELQNRGRAGALNMMVLITDGVVNLPSGNTTNDKAAVIKEANLCAAANIPIVTIALGAEADAALMKQVSDITGGAAYVVPGGLTIAQVKAQLEAVFAQVAADRPVQMVQ